MVRIYIIPLLLASLRLYGDVYIIEKQKERKSTRWTLTEWLKIKERMKLMDTWLAMFSEPKKEKFSPELGLNYQELEGNSYLNFKEGALNGTKRDAEYAGLRMRGHVWLTNLISSQLGVRTLNIDLGMVAQLDQFSENWLNQETPTSNMTSYEFKSFNRLNQLSFRIFGKSIQDSSIVFKAGEYHRTYLSVDQDLGTYKEFSFKGKTIGGSIQLYFMGWLGIEGEVNRFDPSSTLYQTQKLSLSGKSTRYGGFIEISLLRFEGGVQEDEFYLDWSGGSKDAYKSSIKYLGLTLQL